MASMEVRGWIGGAYLGGDVFTFNELVRYEFNLYDELLDDIPTRVGEAFEFGDVDVPDMPDDDLDEFIDFVSEYVDVLCDKKALVISRCAFSADDEGWDYTATLDIDLDKLYLDFLEA